MHLVPLILTKKAIWDVGICTPVTKKGGVLPTTQNYRTPDADLSDPDLLFYLQTSELNNTWWAYWFLQLHSTNQLHSTHTRTESKSQTSIHCLPTLSNTPFSAENISHHIADYLHAESTSSLLGILNIPNLPVTTHSLSLSLSRFLQQNDHTRATRRSGKSGIWPSSLHYKSHTLTISITTLLF